MKNSIISRKCGGVPKPRESNLELFRIITMLLIVAHHYVVNSSLLNFVKMDPLAGNSIFLLLFGAWGKTGINCFVLITGYFMCKSQITIKKFAKLLFEVEFYKIIIWLIFLLTGYETFSLIGFLKSLLPVTQITTNFLGCYLIFYLFIPFLNVLIHNINEKQHILLLLLCTFTYVVIGTVPKFNVTMNYVSWYIVLYLISSYIRLYPKKIYHNTKLWGWSTLGVFIISALSVVCFTWFGAKIGKNNLSYYLLSDSNKLLAVMCALVAFLFFKNLKVKYNKFFLQ